jgi:hypothetical protein
MAYSIKKLIKKYKHKSKESFIFLILFVGVFVACQGALEDGTPFGPSTSIFKILPSTANVTTGADLTYTPFGGTTPYSWTSSNTAIGNIIVNTGVFTAGTTQGTATITAVDAVGNTATASVTIPGLSLDFDVTGATQVVAGAEDIITVLANGSGAGFTVTFVNDNAGSAFLLFPTVETAAPILTFTSPATLPTLAEGNQTFTVTVTDTGNTNTGTLTYVFVADVV